MADEPSDLMVTTRPNYRKWSDDELAALKLAVDHCGDSATMFMKYFIDLCGGRTYRSHRAIYDKMFALNKSGEYPIGARLFTNMYRISVGQPETVEVMPKPLNPPHNVPKVVPPDEEAPHEEEDMEEEQEEEKPAPQLRVVLPPAQEDEPGVLEMVQGALRLSAANYEKITNIEKMLKALCDHLGVKLS